MTSFGIATSPQQVGYADVLRVWREADGVPEIDRAWVFDHLLPIAGEQRGPILEGWTLLSALAAQTQRLRLGVLVTSNRFRPPAMLAKMAATVDAVAGGRLLFGIGAGSRPAHPVARREYEAYGLPFHDADDAMAAFAEACSAIRRLWTEPEPFDVDGEHVTLRGAFCEPKPLQRPHPPIVVGGRSRGLLRVAAEHADVWNVPGFDLEDAIARTARLDRCCEAIGRDPASLVRSIYLPVDYERPETTRAAIAAAVDASFGQIELGLPAPWPAGVATWVAAELLRSPGSAAATSSPASPRGGPR